jgi:peptide/nickel transport system permease protein
MLEFLAKRLAISIPTIVLVSVAVFLMLHFVPGDPAAVFLGAEPSTPERLAEVRTQMGLDRPLHVQYLSYMGGVLRGDFGRSLHYNRTVTDQIVRALPSTLELTLAAMAIATIIGFALGITAAIHHNTWIDSVAMGFALIGLSMPIFWSSLVLIMVFSIQLQWFPAIGQGGIERLVLPATALGVISASVLARMVRSSMLEVLSQDYIRTAVAKGASRRNVIYGHALKNALIPTITILGLQFGNLLSGTVISETIFSRLGIGKLYIDSLLLKDFPTVQGVTLFIAAAYVLVNLLVDVSYAFIDPRIRYD